MARPAVLGSTLTDIFRHHHLLSVSELMELLPASSGKTYNKTSIYRALEKLEEQGLICQHTFTTGETKFELRQSHHDHLVCTECGLIQASESAIEVPTAVGDFQVDHYHLSIFGLCSDCQQKHVEQSR